MINHCFSFKRKNQKEDYMLGLGVLGTMLLLAAAEGDGGGDRGGCVGVIVGVIILALILKECS